MPGLNDDVAVPVLGLLAATDCYLPPAVITHNLRVKLAEPPTKGMVNTAVRALREEGLIVADTDKQGYYRITDAGNAYIEDHGDPVTESVLLPG